MTLISLAVPISRSFDPKLIDESSDEYKDLANEVLALVRPTFESHNPIPGSDFEAHVSFSSSDKTKSKRKWVIKRKNTVIGVESPSRVTETILMPLKTLKRSADPMSFSRIPVEQPETVDADVVCYYKADSKVKIEKVPTGSELRIQLKSLSGSSDLIIEN